MENTPSNVLTGGVVLSSMFDNNLAGVNGHPVSGFEQLISGQLAFKQDRHRLDWSLSSQFTYGRYQHYREPNQYSGQFATELSYSLSKRLQASLAGSYMSTADPYPASTQDTLGSVPGPLVAPADSFLLPRTRRRQLNALTDLSYRLSSFSVAGLTGSVFQLNFPGVPAELERSVRNTLTVTASAYYMHQMSRRQFLGVQYAYMDFYSGPGARTQVNTILAMDRIRFGRTEITVFAGPEIARNSATLSLNLPSTPYFLNVHSTIFRVAAGALLDWKTRAHALHGEAVHRTTDGGGLTTAATTNNGSLNLHSRLSRTMSSDLGLWVTDNHGVGPLAPNGISSAGVNADLTYEMRNGVALSISYNRIHQTGSAALYGYGDHNRAQLSFHYYFTRPLGR